MKLNKRCVAFFPTVNEMSGNPYWPMLAMALEKANVNFLYDTPPYFTWKWLFNNRNDVNVLHIHFIHQFYGSGKPGRIYLLSVLKFAFNLLLARILGYITVFTVHDLEPTYQAQPAWIDNFGHYLAVNLSSRVIVHCKEARRLLSQKYGRTKNVFEVVHPNFIGCYPNTVTKDVARRRLGLPDDVIVFTFLGGIRPNKGIETLIEAFFKMRNDNLRLVIAGKVNKPATYINSLQKMAENDNRISFHLSYISDEDIQIFLNAADIVVLPFTKILTSGSAILAMSFSRPVIAPKMGCLPNLIKPDTGWLYDPDEPNSLAIFMQTSVTCDFVQIGKNAFDRVSIFTPENFAKQTIKAYWN